MERSGESSRVVENVERDEVWTNLRPRIMSFLNLMTPPQQVTPDPKCIKEALKILRRQNKVTF